MFYKYHNKSPWVKRVLVPFWVFQLGFMLALIIVLIYLRAYIGFKNTDIVVLIISAVCTILSITEIILFAATRLHPLTYLILQLVKTITWFVLFVLAAVGTRRVESEMKIEEEQGYSLGNEPQFFFLSGFVETLVLFITFFTALIYASIVYHRHHRAKSRFLGSVAFHSNDLFPVIADVNIPNNSHRVLRAPRNSSTTKEAVASGAEEVAEMKKEAVEMTLLRELGGDWEVYELPATRSVRSSRGGSKRGK